VPKIVYFHVVINYFKIIKKKLDIYIHLWIILIMNKCTIQDCNSKYYAKGYCHKHYEKYVYGAFRNHQKPCKFIDCNRNAVKNIYCCEHNKKITTLLKYGFSESDLYNNIDLRLYRMAGKNNPRWNGGTSEYSNHCLMKKIRLEILKKANYVCHFCGKEATQIHHKDLSKDNHSKNNLIACCYKCNSKIRKTYTSKFKRMYGYTSRELADIFGISKTSAYIAFRL